MAANKKLSRKWIYGSNSVITSLILLIILAFVALIAERHPWRVDLTESGTFSLSEQTRNVLKQIDKPITIKCFYATAAPDQMQQKNKTRDLLDTYRYYSKDISYEFIDPDVQPELARKYDIKTYGSLVLEGYDKTQVVPAADEENISSAILKLSRKEQKKIYFMTGHGEHSITGTDKESYANAKAALEKNYYSVQDFNLLQQPDIPSDAAAVVVAGPKKPVTEQEQAILNAYLKRGGKLFVMVDALTDTGMKDFFKSHGIVMGDDVIIDRLSRLFGGSERIPVVVEYGEHKITSNFGLPTFYPDARSMAPDAKLPEGVQVQVLASTSPNSWAERDLDMLRRGEAAFDKDKDLPGPVPIVVLADIANKDQSAGADAAKKDPAATGKAGILVAAGDSDFAANTYFGLYGNGDFFVNTINYLADEANMITIEPKQAANKPLLLTQNQAKAMFWVVLILVPLAVLVSGLAVYRVRRAQR